MRFSPRPNLVVVDDCVPDLGKSKTEKKFTKDYQADVRIPAQLRLGSGLRRVPHGSERREGRLVTTRPRS